MEKKNEPTMSLNDFEAHGKPYYSKDFTGRRIPKSEVDILINAAKENEMAHEMNQSLTRNFETEKKVVVLSTEKSN